MLIIEMAKIELTGSHIGTIPIIEIAKIEILLFIEIFELELTGGYI